MSDKFTAWVRTVVPALWSVLVAWLASLGLPPAVIDTIAGLNDHVTLFGVLVVVPAVLSVVYAALRWVEARVPRWLAVLLLGSTRRPTYHGSLADPAAGRTGGRGENGGHLIS